MQQGDNLRQSRPPRCFDRYSGGFGEVPVRDLQLYEAISQGAGGDLQ
jgi:hypothetical protein